MYLSLSQKVKCSYKQVSGKKTFVFKTKIFASSYPHLSFYLVDSGKKEKRESSFYYQGIIIGSCILGLPIIAIITFVAVRYHRAKKERQRLKNREKEKFLANNNTNEDELVMHSMRNMYG